ncbi:hypothetical protein [Flammeovirga pacifica]|uniref:Uncharacterized protein n=1 Tax=Flammeovirga pacifica TaxID=915059 RepID=A0A1S1Z0E2_FLAPC|nr:hypothetical protein [Flammeovirga pacifica]OHX66721.1 hypothetical protein NH26_10310 [Flammeovirga pacifica]
MIDGVFISCDDLSKQWRERKIGFSFAGNEETGELYPVRSAWYKGLKLIIRESKGKTYCEIKGSLHKFWNDGEHNSDTYTYQNYLDTLPKLQNELGVNPSFARLHNLEYGINVNTPIQAEKVLKGLIAYKNKGFEGVTIDNKFYYASISNRQYKIKAYDKGKQQHKKDNGKTLNRKLLRLEFHYNKMEQINKMGVYTLQDLANKEVFAKFGERLLSVWGDSVFIDRSNNSMRLKEMTEAKRTRFYSLLDSKRWNEFTNVQRSRKLKVWRELMVSYSNSLVQTSIYKNIESELGIVIGEKCIQNDHFLKMVKVKKVGSNKNEKCIQNDTLCKGSFPNISPTSKTEKPKQKKCIQNDHQKDSKKCACCGADISHKYINAKYCSRACNNKYNRNKRKRINETLKKKEMPILNKILKEINKNGFKLLITYTSKRKRYKIQLQQKEVFASSKWISKIKEVQVWTNKKGNKRIVLTGTRAKKIIRVINKMNQKK